jgi:hypothetical protein
LTFRTGLTGTHQQAETVYAASSWRTTWSTTS